MDGSPHEALSDDHSGSIALPPHPSTPDESDCCGSGCIPCVFDIHEKELALWRAECDRIQHGDARDTMEACITPDHYSQLRLISIEQESCDSYIYTFATSSELKISPGQHLVLRWRNESEAITRQYTPIRISRNGFEVLIKIYKHGKMSQYISTWKVGDSIEWRGPLGHLSYKPNQHKRLLLLAAGTGIAPMLQIISHVLGNEDDETRVRLMYSCRSRGDILCKATLDEWLDFWNFSVVYYLSQDSKENKRLGYRDQVVFSRLTEDLLKEELKGDDLPSMRVIICGTRSFDNDMMQFVASTGLHADQYQKL